MNTWPLRALMPVVVLLLSTVAIFNSALDTPLEPSYTFFSSPCDIHFRNYNTDSFYDPILATNNGSTGKICVQLHNLWTGKYAQEIWGNAYITIYQYNSSATRHGVCPGCPFNEVSSLFQLSVSQNTSILQPGETRLLIYTVTVPPDTPSGVYGISIAGFCWLIPMVVHRGSLSDLHLTGLDFSEFFPPVLHCPADVGTAHLLGVSGLEQVFV